MPPMSRIAGSAASPVVSTHSLTPLTPTIRWPSVT